MIAAQVAALNNLRKAQDTDGRAVPIYPTSHPDPTIPGVQGVGQGETLCHSLPTGKNLLYSASPDVSCDEHTGRFTHSEESVRAGGDQGLEESGEEGDEDDTDDDYGIDVDGPPQTTFGNSNRTTEGSEERRPAQPTMTQPPIDNLELLRRISDTETRQLALDSERPTVEIRAVAAAEARVAQEARRLMLDEAKILALTESDTHK